MKIFLFIDTNFCDFYKDHYPWVLEFVVSNTTGNSQMGKLYLVRF